MTLRVNRLLILFALFFIIHPLVGNASDVYDHQQDNSLRNSEYIDTGEETEISYVKDSTMYTMNPMTLKLSLNIASKDNAEIDDTCVDIVNGVSENALGIFSQDDTIPFTVNKVQIKNRFIGLTLSFKDSGLLTDFKVAAKAFNAEKSMTSAKSEVIEMDAIDCSYEFTIKVPITEYIDTTKDVVVMLYNFSWKGNELHTTFSKENVDEKESVTQLKSFPSYKIRASKSSGNCVTIKSKYNFLIKGYYSLKTIFSTKEDSDIVFYIIFYNNEKQLKSVCYHLFDNILDIIAIDSDVSSFQIFLLSKNGG